ncbi:MAG: FAD-dependent oxidoreductase [Alphaproteobacteria bacterium]|nr:FAD-dependent oxidoreductase [Alphaproteobacteria bacterium]
MALTHVLEPIRIAGRTLKNRVVRTAHATGIGGGTMSDDLIAYHEARAIGGVGLSVLEILSVHPTSPAPLNMFDPSLDEGYGKLMEAVRPHGMAVFQQIWHAGHNGTPLDGSPPWSPSDVPNPLGGSVPIPMTKDMIDEIIAAYAAAAARCDKAGLDGVELHCAHGYLVQQFLSPNVNKRTDDYGGPFENRIRFMLETLRAMRAAVRPGFAVGIRVAPDMTGGGVGVEMNQMAVERVQQDNLVDFVNVSMGNYNSFPKMIGGMHEPMGYELPTSVPIAARAKVPTIVIGRVRTLEEADQIIRQGEADMVGMTRAHIADPDLVRKTVEGRVDEVRPCIACNQGCVGNLLGPAHRMGCAVNPGVGFERSIGDDRIGRAEAPKKVLVIGGGPAGLEAARVAALRGHEVVLAEATDQLGGMMNFAAKLPKRHGIADIVKWQEAEIFRLGVEVRLGTYMEADDVTAEAPDAVIVATGSMPRMDGIQSTNPGEPVARFDRPNVLSSIDLLTHGRNRIGKSAVVIDDVGHYEAIGVAEYLVEAGAAVSFVTTQAMFGPKVETALMTEPALERLSGKDFRVYTRYRVTELGDEEATIAPTHAGAKSRVPAETVVFVSANRPNRELFDELRGKIPEVHVVGDANSPRFLQTAIREGHLAAKAI